MKSLFDLPTLTDKEIEEKRYSSSDLWLLKFKTQVIGPYHTDTLIEFAEHNQQVMEQVLACSFSQDSWNLFFQNPRFQRRTPKLIKAQTLIPSDEFMLLVDGQKCGPFSAKEINEKLDQGKVLSSDEASLDKGETWFKIYEHHSFDRRTHKSSNDIPFSPKENDIIEKKVKVVDSYELPIVRGQEEFIRLAHFARNNQPEDKKLPVEGKSEIPSGNPAEVIDFPKAQYHSENPIKRYTYGILACVLLITIFSINEFVLDKDEAPTKYSSQYKKQLRKPASINRKKPVAKTVKKSIRKNYRKPLKASAPKRRMRARNKINKKRVKNYHRKDKREIALDDPYQKLIDNESSDILDTNRPEDKEFLNDLKREIANERDEYREEEDRAMDEGEEYEEEEDKPIVEKDPYAEDPQDRDQDPPEDY